MAIQIWNKSDSLPRKITKIVIALTIGLPSVYDLFIDFTVGNEATISRVLLEQYSLLSVWLIFGLGLLSGHLYVVQHVYEKLVLYADLCKLTWLSQSQAMMLKMAKDLSKINGKTEAENWDYYVSLVPNDQDNYVVKK